MVSATRFLAELRERARKDEMVKIPAAGHGGGQDPAADVGGNPLESGLVRRPLSRPESRLWVLQSSDPNSITYNVWKAVRITGRLDPPIMRSALIEVISRHDILRTTYELRDGVPEAVIHSEPRLDWLAEDVESEESAMQAATAESVIPFAIDSGPLIRARLFRWAADAQILLLNFHHLVIDGPSRHLLWDEASRLYQAYREGGHADLPELRIRYGDWAARENLELTKERAAKSRQFWLEKLADPPAVLEFPGARRRPSKFSYRGRWVTVPLSEAASTAAQRLAAEERTTLYLVFLAAFLALIHRSTGAADLVIGTPFSGRRGRDTEPLIGFFVNMLAMRFKLEGDPTFRKWLGYVRSTFLDYFEHAATPFEDIIEGLRIERNPSAPPLFQAVFLCNVLHDTDSVDNGALDVENVALDNGTAKFDLTLTIEVQPHRIDCTLEYSTDIYDAAVASRILENFRALVEAAVENPDLTCGAIPLPPAPPEALEGARPRYPEQPIQAVFEQTAALHSGREALVCDSERVTYADLNRRANILAGFLQAEGVRPGDTVAILMERSIEYVAGLLAVLKCGGVWVPLAPSDPPARVKALLEDCGARTVLVKERAPRGFDAGAARIVPLPRLEKRKDPGNPRVTVPLDQAPLDQAACIMYTSGSTGVPKGVLVRHRGILRLLFGVDYAELGPDTTMTFMAPLQFDASTFELFGTILHGGRCIIVRQGFPGVEDFAALVRREGVNTCWLTTPLFHAVVEQSVDALRPVRQLLTGGEVTSPEHVRRALDALPETRIVHCYGPTETTTFAYCYSVPRDLDPAARSIPIGRPIANTHAIVVDRRMRPLPACAIGELFIGGDGLAEGYLNAPQLTAEKFVSVPGLPGSSGRLYRTGDLVYAGPDNLLYFVGRTDGQVKIRGNRVEPGEVESALLRLPGVQNAAVIAKPEASGAMSLVAYYVPHAGAGMGEDLVLGALKRVLPAYMVPARAVPLDAIPLKASGKLDRAALPDPPAVERKPAGLAHIDSTELLLLQVWHEFFPGQEISVEDDFFSLGGHSLMAVRLMARVERQFGKRLPASALFEAPTVRSLAALLSAEKHEPKDAARFAALQPLGGLPPLFFVGAGPKQRLFAQRLGAGRPCLSPVPRLGHNYGPTFLMDLAAQYAADIRRAQPHGPYYLAGWSRCGLLALEIAQKLRGAGEEVALLILVDTYLPDVLRGIGMRNLVSARATRAMRLLGALPELVREKGGIRRRFAELAAYLQQSGMARRVWKLRSAISRTLLKKPVIIEGWHDLAWAINASAAVYVPKPYDSPVLFLLAEDKPAGPAFNPLKGWERLLKQIRVETVPGDHETMFRPPNVDIVAAAVNKYLKD